MPTDYSVPMVQLRNDIDPLSRALQEGRREDAIEISQRMRRCVFEVIAWADRMIEQASDDR